MNQSTVEEIAPTLIAAIETILNPNVKREDRHLAHKVCEEFKETSPMCVPVGLFLAQTVHKPIVRHFGLQLLEHVIKFRWNGMTQSEKDYLKENALKLIAVGTQNLLEEEFHIKDAVSRITVELIKREWPQLWPDLQQDLYKLSQKGETQTELVLKVYLRIVEDAVLFQTIPNQRRREIMLALTSNMEDLFSFFVTVLKEHTDAVDQIQKSGQVVDPKVIQAHNMASEAALCTLAGYLDWVHMQHIMAKNALLLQMTCLLLSNSSLQLYAAECLHIIVSRKGKLEDRKPLLVLFSEDAMNIVLRTVADAEAASSTDEYYYLFLKKLCLLLVELGKQLASLWGNLPNVGQPQNFSTYLEAVFAFTQHPSRMLCSYTQPLWALFFRHEHMSKDPILLSFIPRLIQGTHSTLVKAGFPTQNNSPSCEYSRHDFDSDDDFHQFSLKLRSEISETLRLATVLQPVPAFTYAFEWLKSQLQKPIDTGGTKDYCTLFSPSFLEWDAMTVCLECVITKLSYTKSIPDLNAGVVLLNEVLNYQTQDALIMSALLSTLSALFPFLDNTHSSIMTVLQKIFSAVTFNQEGQTKSTRSKAVKNVRQHACSILVKMCKQYSDLIFSVFDQLYNHIKTISSDSEGLSQMEKCILMEALILISNKCNNFTKQSEFIEEILRPVKEFYLSKEFTEAFWDPDKWMSFIGVDQAPVEPSSADTCGINRSHIGYCTNMILAVLKRSKWPEEAQAAEAGGFIIGKKEEGTPIYRNPATSHISLLLENLLAFMKTMNAVWQPQYLQKRHPSFSRCYDLLENEKLAILGVPAPCVDITVNQNKHPSDRMQNFLVTTNDNNCHILGNAGQCLGYEFFTIPNLAQSFINTVLSNMEHLPDYRIKPIIKVLLKSYIQSCPVDLYTTAVIPVFEYVCPFLYQHLTAKWTIINQRSSEEGAEDNMETQEVIEDQLTRQLNREYMELLAIALNMKRNEGATNTEEERMEDTENTCLVQKEEAGMSKLGYLCMSTKTVYPSIMMYVFSALTWSDSVACHRGCNLAWSMMKQLVVNGDATSDIAGSFFYQVLCGLQVHGQHEGSQALLLNLALQLYELLRPKFPEITSVLLQIPNNKEQDIQSFDEKVIFVKSPKQGLGEKKKKESFKRLVSEIIGKSIGQQFKRETQYRNLPPIFRIRPPKEDVIKKQEDTGLWSLFNPTNGHNS